jgi:hypothetical protein
MPLTRVNFRVPAASLVVAAQERLGLEIVELQDASHAQRILAGLLALAHSDSQEIIESIECTLQGNDVAVALSSVCCAPELARYASRMTELGLPLETMWW